jgi:superfamily I DNA/RNA helicase
MASKKSKKITILSKPIETKPINISDIVAEVDIQSRTSLNSSLVEEYADDLSNIHKIKGKGFKVVFILGSYDTIFERKKIFDDQKTIDDEIRTIDTAITRTKRYLYFLFPMTKKDWDERRHEKNPSIFIRNCPDNLYEVYTVIRCS